MIPLQSSSRKVWKCRLRPEKYARSGGIWNGNSCGFFSLVSISHFHSHCHSRSLWNNKKRWIHMNSINIRDNNKNNHRHHHHQQQHYIHRYYSQYASQSSSPSQSQSQEQSDKTKSYPLIPRADIDPVAVLRSWLIEAQSLPNGSRIAHVACLATIDHNDNRPSARMISCSGINSQGQLQFCTTLTSRKYADIQKNPHVSMVFNWNMIQKAVRIDGIAETASAETSNDAWRQRNREYQLWALTTRQNREIKDISEFEEELRASEKLCDRHGFIERPAHWSAFWVTPLSLEFWKGHEKGIHQRHQYYRQTEKDSWKLRMLEP